MGMTIDDAIETLKDTNTYGTADIAKRVAVNTMRKYQKIEQIVKQYKKFGNIDFSMQIICGVVVGNISKQ